MAEEELGAARWRRVVLKLSGQAFSLPDGSDGTGASIDGDVVSLSLIHI